MTDLHRTGHCIVCSHAVFQIKDTYKSGVMKGYPKKIGRPLDGARRANIFLMDGTTTDWTVCAVCVPLIDCDLPRLWDKVLRTFMFLQAHAAERGIRAYTSAQAMAFNRQMQDLAVNKPLGVRNVRDWAEILNG